MPHIVWDSHLSYAIGKYYNDDGSVLDTKGNANRWVLNYNHNLKTDRFAVQFYQDWEATYYNSSRVNMNDALGDIYIYNAKAEGLNSTFEANAYLKNGTIF
jgi:hypothetical protein